ncbi:MULTISPECIES: primary-amine oxidase [Amycolatopsis]|uniref:primary-amine oxidase n=1 Tax=Amycolatopsis TaxID=1813 RepID=UPI0007DFAA3D|nr:primary-amine oxidase [Amycolatopsis sp. M39]OAP22903.1 Primary amine oxidase precursor [Amycolatopsis sp. M39]
MTSVSYATTGGREIAESGHPLDPLTAAEIRSVTRMVRTRPEVNDRTRFVSITLLEPAKHAVQAYPEKPCPQRDAFIVLRQPDRKTSYEATVSLTGSQITSWRQVPDVQPAITLEEFMACKAVVREDERWRSALHDRGVADVEETVVDAWTVGHHREDGRFDDRRLAHALTFVLDGEGDNPYARPVDGLRVLVDLDEMSVVDVEDRGGPPLPPHAGNYTEDLIGREDNWTPVDRVRDDLHPIVLAQPEGPSFRVDGYAVEWQKWRFRLGFTPREGLVLHQLGFSEKGRTRPVVHRAALSEIFTPYGDPGLVHSHKQAFDEGEYGAGYMVNSLSLGCDCLGDITYFDVVVHDDRGEPITIRQAICMHEEDYGVGWKHTDFRTGDAVTRRARRLVVSTFSALGNYQYGYFWYLYLDGTIEFEVKLTGMISTGTVAPGEKPVYGTLVAPGLYGPNHQHFFNVRLDMCVNGNDNSVYEVNSELAPPQDNPFGHAWLARRTLLATEREAQRTIDPAHGRHWLIVNPNVRNRLGEPVGYKLAAGANVLPIQAEGTEAHRRAGFAYKHLWVTAYDPAQLYAGGDYPNQHPGDGLPEYAKADRPLDNTDVVVWYTFGDHHVVRPEDWPVMPVTTVGFQLKPFGFFDGNPALDVPAPTPHCAPENSPHTDTDDGRNQR